MMFALQMVGFGACALSIVLNLYCAVRMNLAARAWMRASSLLTGCAVKSFVRGHRGTFEVWSRLSGCRLSVVVTRSAFEREEED